MGAIQRAHFREAISSLLEFVRAFWPQISGGLTPRPKHCKTLYQTSYATVFLRAVYKADCGSPQSRLMARVALNVLHDPKRYAVNVSELLLLDEEQRNALVAFLNARAVVPYKHLQPANQIERFLVPAFPERYEKFKGSGASASSRARPLRLVANQGRNS